jgi:hypothetical protein
MRFSRPSLAALIATMLVVGSIRSADACPNITGNWFRSLDNVTTVINQNGCNINTVLNSSGFTHSGTGAGDASNTFSYQLTRTNRGDGCTVVMTGSITQENPSTIRIVLSGNGCDLKNYSEDYLWTKQ